MEEYQELSMDAPSNSDGDSQSDDELGSVKDRTQKEGRDDKSRRSEKRKKRKAHVEGEEKQVRKQSSKRDRQLERIYGADQRQLLD